MDPENLDPHWKDWGSWNDLVKEKMRVKEIKAKLKAEGFVGYATGQANLLLDGWKPISEEVHSGVIHLESAADATKRIQNRVKDHLGDTWSGKPYPICKENTWGNVPMATQTVTEMATGTIAYCDFPDDGSGHICPQDPTSLHRLMSIKMDGKTYNCCYECWANKYYTDVKAIAQLNEVGGHKEGRDPPLGATPKFFRELTNRIHYQEKSQIPFDPESTKEALEASCKANYYRMLLDTPPGVAKEMLRKMQVHGYTKIVKNLVKQGETDTPAEWPEEWRTMTEATARAAIKCREDFGDQKLAQLHASLSFCRCVSGKPGKAGAVYVAWICPRCKHMPGLDFNWYKCEGNFDGNSWFCACCGMQFIYGVDGFLFGWQLTDDPNSIVWASAEPPEGLALNYLDYMKFGNAIFNGNFDAEAFARASTAEERLKCLVDLVTKDNKLFLIAITDPRIKRITKRIAAPVNPKQRPIDSPI